MNRLGTILQSKGTLAQAQLDDALHLQKKQGGRLGDILIGEGYTNYYGLYQAIAEQHALAFIDLLKEPPEFDLIKQVTAESCLRYRSVPWRRQGNTIVIATAEQTETVKPWAKKHFGTDIDFVITSPFDIRRTVEKYFGSALERSSRLSLWQRFPDISARFTLPQKKQREFLTGLAALSAILLLIYPLQTALAFVAFCHIAYAITMTFKMLIFSRGAACATNEPSMQQHLASLDEKELPVYTVLVPMYRETESLPGLLDAMQKMDYPASKLDIKLVLEADDHETLRALEQLKPGYQFEVIKVPPSQPRTKPKACNYALRFARGEFITIFDADDRPDKLQLKKAVLAFRTLPADVACLQARLNYYNVNDNWLTRFFSLEYTTLFHFMLYGLQRSEVPIPLGGTSNHISLKRLSEVGEWDPFNVTEDADLGTRLAARGLRTVMLDSYTMEEAPNSVMPWIKQRSRWIKGYMQTWLVHMRAPVKLYRELGLKGFVGFQCFVGLSCFTFLTAPIVWAASLLWIGQMTAWHHVSFPEWLGWLTFINLLLNLFTHWYIALYCAILYRKHTLKMINMALVYPLYLILHSIASYKALSQLIVKPHFWEKTVHGLARTFDEFSLNHEALHQHR